MSIDGLGVLVKVNDRCIMCPVIEGVSRKLACLMMSSLLVLSSVSYCACELGVHVTDLMFDT